VAVRGRLIVFEGVEGGGKSTQLKRSHDWLRSSDLWRRLQDQGILSDVVVTREPGGTQLGQAIRQLLLTPTEGEGMGDRTELLLYAADRAQHVDQQLRPLLESGVIILCDRFVDSTVAYQGYGRGLDLALIHHLNQIATHGLSSDLTLWLDLPAELGLARTQKRGVADRMEQNSLGFHQRVQQGFATIAQQQPDRTVRIEASHDPDTVFSHVQSAIESALQRWYGDLL